MCQQGSMMAVLNSQQLVHVPLDGAQRLPPAGDWKRATAESKAVPRQEGRCWSPSAELQRSTEPQNRVGDQLRHNHC
jgi:hypothetical protein